MDSSFTMAIIGYTDIAMVEIQVSRKTHQWTEVLRLTDRLKRFYEEQDLRYDYGVELHRCGCGDPDCSKAVSYRVISKVYASKEK